MVSASAASCLVVASAAANRCLAFQPGPPKLPTVRRRGIGIGPLRAELRASEESAHATAASLDPDIASQFTIQVCTSTNCSRRLNEAGLDKYHALGELYARAQAANVEKCVIVEDGTCQGGRNCKMGPCVAIQHEDFDGNVALEGMNSNEFRERVFHNVLTDGDSERVWSCVENAITMMTEEES